MTLWVLAIGVVLTAGLALAAWSVHTSNEERLLRQRTREAGALLTVALPSLEAPLGAAAFTAERTDGAEDEFTRFMGPLIGPMRPFVSASVWDTASDRPSPLVTVGAAPLLAGLPPEQVESFLVRSVEDPELSVIDFLDASPPRLGYSTSVIDAAPRYVVYAEAELPADRLSSVPEDNAFSGLDFALYLGDSANADHLLAASTPDLPFDRRTASEDVAFGDSSFHLVVAAKGQLGGWHIAFLPWLVLIVGLGMTVGSTALTERLLRGRDHAERLAAENEALYRGQRTVALTLQHSLLPSTLPTVPGVELAARYESGTAGLEVGGDWYDVMELPGDRLLFVVGDVSGRGLPAATMMGSLRSQVEAYAVQGDPPGTILAKLARLVAVEQERQFATVVCGRVDVRLRHLTLANAGHPQPIVVHQGRAESLEVPVGPPIGVQHDATYEEVSVTLAEGSTLLAFTDGLFERRGERIDAGLGRLRSVAAECEECPVDEVLSVLLDRLVPSGAEDDTAILGMRWEEPDHQGPLEDQPQVPMRTT